MPKLREASDLAAQERKRIVAGWNEVNEDSSHWEALRVIAACFNVHEDTVRLVLSEEGG